jgi:nitroreductase
MSYFDYFGDPIEKTLKKRVSCRTYEDRLLDNTHKNELLSFCENVNKGLWGETIDYQLVEFTVEELKAKKIAGYVLFKNARSFVVGVIDKSDLHNVSYGYALEHIVLKATELGLGTCWAGYFDPYLIKDVPVGESGTVPAICLVGYAAARRTFREKVARFVIKASKRKDWNRLFYNGDFKTALTSETAGPYAEPLEFLRLAPSSGNTQPWRIVKEKNQHVYHFFKQIVKASYEEKKMHDIDIGIAMCHFELGAAKNRFRGKWERTDHKVGDAPKKTDYIISWIPE